jgi:cytochrome c biogenesis protein CcdA
LLLLVYAAGLALPFLLVGIGFDRALGAFRAGCATTAVFR